MPCGTPYMTDVHFEHPFNITRWRLPVRNDFNQFRIRMPYPRSLCKWRECGTVSNAFLKSVYTISTPVAWSSMLEVQSLKHSRRLVRHEHFALNPCCSQRNMLLSMQNRMTCICTNFSNSLTTWLVRILAYSCLAIYASPFCVTHICLHFSSRLVECLHLESIETLGIAVQLGLDFFQDNWMDCIWANCFIPVYFEH